MTDDVVGRWLIRSPVEHAQIRLICCPYVGGAASAYRPWFSQLAPHIEVCAVQLPGRETRYAEPLCDDLASLVDQLRDVVLRLDDRPFAIFGHSLGALLGFELARELRRIGAAEPTHLFVSAYQAPQLPRLRKQLYDVPPALLLQELRRLEGTPEAVLNNAELVHLLLPILRSDFKLCDTYCYVEQPPLACPLIAVGGDTDQLAPTAALAAWQQQTSGPFQMKIWSGGHFFIRDWQPQLLALIRSQLMSKPMSNDEIQ